MQHEWSKSPQTAAGDSTTTPCQAPPHSTLPHLLKKICQAGDKDSWKKIQVMNI